MKLRLLLAPAGAIGGPVVAGALALCARLLNRGRLRPLTGAERRQFGTSVTSAELSDVLVAEHATLPLLPGFVAVTLGREIYVRGSLGRLPRSLLAHELAHVRQFRQRGWMQMTAEYGRLWVEHGYHAHPMEVEARAAERQMLARR